MVASAHSYRDGSGSRVSATVALVLSTLCLMAVDPSPQLTGHPTHRRVGNCLACCKYTVQRSIWRVTIVLPLKYTTMAVKGNNYKEVLNKKKF